MLVRAFQISLVMVAAFAARSALAADPPATRPIASYVEQPVNGTAPKSLYYQNEDVVTLRKPSSIRTQEALHSQALDHNVVVPKSELFTTSSETATTRGSTNVLFSIDGSGGPYASALAGPQLASFSFYAVSTQAPVLGSNGSFSQIFDSGTLSFTLATPLQTIDAHGSPVALSNLLTISFTNALFTAGNGGLTFGFAAGTPGSTISATSDFLQFTDIDVQAAFDFAISGADVSVPIAQATGPSGPTTGTRSLNSFRASSSGAFAGVLASVVPEPGNWALFLVGFAAIGLSRRTERQRAIAGAPQHI